LFFLIILSHGSEDGIIYTDTVGRDQCYESFTGEVVLKALKTNKHLNTSLKVVLFGVSYKMVKPIFCNLSFSQSCRGGLGEKKSLPGLVSSFHCGSKENFN